MLSSPLSWIARAAAAFAAALTLASCGGGVSANPSPVVDSATLTILPATATMYSGLPTTFILSGGTGAYIVTSDNQAILPISGGVTGRSVTLVPNPVVTDTTVTLTLRDTGAATPVTATLTVRPGTVNNDITITRTSTITGCTGVALCNGGDAEVTVRLSQGGIPLPARGVGFSVVSGDFQFIVAGSQGGGELLASSVSTVTDQTGVARARIRIDPTAANQTAQMQVTDLGSGAFQRTSFVIAQVTQADASFYTVPASLDFIGPQLNVCASGSAVFYVYGGRPPYVVTSTTSAFQVAVPSGSNPPVRVSESGGGFTVLATGGSCPSDGIAGTVLVTDATGRVRTVPLTNKPTTDTLQDLVVAPTLVTLSGCSDRATVTIAGGTGSYYFGSGSGAIAQVGRIPGNSVTIQRNIPSPAVTPLSGQTYAEVSAGISDGRSTVSVTVRLDGPAGYGACP
jgi:hypothetical protein